jgi:hypothetical protein
MVDRRLHIAADCSADEKATFDLATFLERMLLFEQYTIRTHQCREVDALVRQIGLIPTTKLIESGTIRIHDAPSVIGAMNLETSPPFEYNIQVVELAREDQGGHDYLGQHIDALELPGGSNRASAYLRGLLKERAITTVPTKLGGLHETESDLRDRRDLLRLAVKAELARHGFSVDAFHVEATASSHAAIRIETDLAERLGLPVREVHTRIGFALMSLADTNLELTFMEDLDAVGVADSRIEPILDAKVKAVAEGAGAVSGELSRVLEVAGLPDIRMALRSGQVHLPRFLAAVGSDEAREFRAWIRSTTYLSEDDLRQALAPLRLKAQSWQYKALMLVFQMVAPVAIGSVNMAAGIVAGPVLGAVDAFILQSLLAAPGPAVFLKRKIGRALLANAPP